MNPIDKKEEIIKLLEDYKINYKIFESSENIEEYEYLKGNDICITLKNKDNEKMYIDLEDDGFFTISFNEWHNHYYPDYYDKFIEDLKDIIENKKCAIIMSSTKRWITSYLSTPTSEENYNYINDIKDLPTEFINEIKTLGGIAKQHFWDTSKNKITKIEKEVIE